VVTGGAYWQWEQMTVGQGDAHSVLEGVGVLMGGWVALVLMSGQAYGRVRRVGADRQHQFEFRGFSRETGLEKQCSRTG